MDKESEKKLVKNQQCARILDILQWWLLLSMPLLARDGSRRSKRKPLRSCRLREVTEHDTNHSSSSSYSNLRLQSGSSTAGVRRLRTAVRAVDQKKSYIAWTPHARATFFLVHMALVRVCQSGIRSLNREIGFNLANLICQMVELGSIDLV